MHALKIPNYRRIIVRGKPQAGVRLRDCETRRIKDYYLGTYGSDESRERYRRVVMEWQANGRRLAPGALRPVETLVAPLLDAHDQMAGGYYSPNERLAFRAAAGVVREFYGSIPTSQFGMAQLRAVQAQMVAKGWGRQNINRQIGRVRQIFGWGRGERMVSADTVMDLVAVRGLKKGHTPAPEPIKVPPVSPHHVAAIRTHVPPMVWLLIQIQRHTAARPGELVGLRAGDITITRRPGIWTSKLDDHKTAHHGKPRCLYFGPGCQKLLRAQMQGLKADDWLFPSERGRPYAEQSYCQAIQRGCAAAGIPGWQPNQLRHLAATEINAKYGLVAASLFLGHASAKITDAVYAERDQAVLRKVAKGMG